MVERKSKKTGSDVCSVKDCQEPKKKSLSMKKVQKACPSMKFKESGKRVNLCRNHSKEFKKATKTERELSKLGRN